MVNLKKLRKIAVAVMQMTYICSYMSIQPRRRSLCVFDGANISVFLLLLE